MVMVADSLPGLKRWTAGLGLRDGASFWSSAWSSRSCCTRGGCPACGRLGRCVRDATPGPDQPFPARPRWRKLDINSILRQKLLEQEASDGLFLFLVDATLNSQAGKKTENTYSTGNRKRRPRKGRRYGKKKHAQKNCHSFTMGLLITPSGIRIPFCKPYYTHEYCKKTGRAHRTTAEAAADLIRELPLPEEGR